MSPPRAPSGPPSFEHQAAARVQACQRAVGELLRSLRVDPAEGPTRVARALEIDTKLAWKLTNLVTREEPFEAGRYVPGRTATRRLLEALERLSPPAGRLAAVHRAVEEFHGLVRARTGDRRSFDMLLAGRAADEQVRAELEQRRQAFQANGYLWGLRSELQLKTVVLAVSPEDEDRFDAAIVTGFAGLERIRTHVPWRITSAYSVDDQGVVGHGSRTRPLDERVAPGEPPLLTDWCSDPPPRLEPLVQLEGAVDYGLAADEGHAAPLTCVLGELLESVESRRRTARNRSNSIYMRLRTPCRLAVLDVVAPPDLFGRRRGEGSRYVAHLFSDLFSGQRLTAHPECDRLALQEGVRRSRGLEDCGLEALPRYRELLGSLLGRLELGEEDVELHRMAIPYPILPTDLVLETDLLPARRT